ncbi:MAG: cupin domain-containing protein, partial [Verrucomicrobiota bacterium]
MVKELQSILLENIEISLPGYLLQRLALNQHMPKVEKLSEHRHGHDQWLLYLRGSGRQRILDRETPVRRGTVLFVGRDTSHRFRKDSEVRPVCLVIDLEVTSSWDVPQEGMMSARELE